MLNIKQPSQSADVLDPLINNKEQAGFITHSFLKKGKIINQNFHEIIVFFLLVEDL